MTISQDHDHDVYHYVVAPARPPVAVHLDPESPEDCQRLSDAIYNECGVEVDPLAVADALRTLRRAR